LSGWLTAVWNERPHFFLTTEAGESFELSIPEDLMQALGGPLALDRKRVRVEGKRRSAGIGITVIEVTSISLDRG
jgi:hypothetical protein